MEEGGTGVKGKQVGKLLAGETMKCNQPFPQPPIQGTLKSRHETQSPRRCDSNTHSHYPHLFKVHPVLPVLGQLPADLQPVGGQAGQQLLHLAGAARKLP